MKLIFSVYISVFLFILFSELYLAVEYKDIECFLVIKSNNTTINNVDFYNAVKKGNLDPNNWLLSNFFNKFITVITVIIIFSFKLRGKTNKDCVYKIISWTNNIMLLCNFILLLYALIIWTFTGVICTYVILGLSFNNLLYIECTIFIINVLCNIHLFGIPEKKIRRNDDSDDVLLNDINNNPQNDDFL